MARVKKTCTDDNCCLHDPDSKQFQCVSRYENGSACDYYAKYQSPYCELHNKMCGQIYGNYKNICDEIWNTPYELDDYSDEQLNYIKRRAKDCRESRREHLYECAGGRADPGHMGAIEKMDAIIGRVNEEFEDRVYRGRKQQRMSLLDSIMEEVFLDNSSLYKSLKRLTIDSLLKNINRINLRCQFDTWKRAHFPSTIKILDYSQLTKDELMYFLIIGRECLEYSMNQ